MRFIQSQWTPSAKRRRTRSRSVLDVTGFAGVMLVLLFLMMFGEMYRMHPHSLPVDMAVARHSSSLSNAQREDAVIITITRDGTLYVNYTRILPADLPDVLRDMMYDNENKTVYVNADARAKYGDVKAVLDQIRLAAIRNVTFLVEQHFP